VSRSDRRWLVGLGLASVLGGLALAAVIAWMSPSVLDGAWEDAFEAVKPWDEGAGRGQRSVTRTRSDARLSAPAGVAAVSLEAGGDTSEDPYAGAPEPGSDEPGGSEATRSRDRRDRKPEGGAAEERGADPIHYEDDPEPEEEAREPEEESSGPEEGAEGERKEPPGSEASAPGEAKGHYKEPGKGEAKGHHKEKAPGEAKGHDKEKANDKAKGDYKERARPRTRCPPPAELLVISLARKLDEARAGAWFAPPGPLGSAGLSSSQQSKVLPARLGRWSLSPGKRATTLQRSVLLGLPKRVLYLLSGVPSAFASTPAPRLGRLVRTLTKRPSFFL
jgi:hypothetical protein